jgi:hypothetical protein
LKRLQAPDLESILSGPIQPFQRRNRIDPNFFARYQRAIAEARMNRIGDSKFGWGRVE